MKRETVLEANKLTIGYKSRGKGTSVVHSNLSFMLRKGELVSLLGANGAGKSTLLRTLASAQPALGGELLLHQHPITNYTAGELARNIALVLTERSVTGGLTVREVVALGRHPYTGFFGRLSSTDKARVEESIQAVGIAHKADSYLAQLSDGERQKVMIAKALAQESPFILLDEPTSFLDVASRVELFALLYRLAEEEGKTILLSTHDVEQALTLSHRLWLLTPKGLSTGVTEDVVLRGELATLFPESSIQFDANNGTFRPQLCSTKRLAIRAEGELFHWACNALLRKGFAPILHQTRMKEEYLHILSPTCLEWHIPDKEVVRFTSFEQLLENFE